MAREKVDISVDADTARAIANLTELVRKQAEIGEAAEKSSKRAAGSTREWGHELSHVVGQWTSMTKAMDLAIEGIKKVLEQAKKIREEQVGATRTIDTGVTAYRIAQGNLSPAAGLDAASRISTIAQENKASNISALSTATLLAQYGVGREQAEGPALDELLKLQDLGQAQGVADPMGLSRSVINLLQRYKRPITGESIRGVGSSFFGLRRQLKGFDEGELQITSDVATLARKAGMGPEEAAGVVGLLSEQFGEGVAKRRFRTLFKDNEYSLAEKKEIAALRGRAAQLRSGSTSDYETAVGIAGSSMTDEESQAQASYEASGFTPGIMDSDTIRKRLLTDIRRQRGGPSPFMEWAVGMEFSFFNELASPFSTNPSQFAVETIAAIHGKTPESQAGIRNRVLGRQETVFRILGPDGRDVPVQSEAEALNTDFSNDATQSANFRP